MATLADQIIEMLSMLEVVDPAAANAIRRGTPAWKAPVAAAPEIAQPVAVVKKAAPTAEFNLKITPTTDTMLQAVIYSEILGKPLAKRSAKRPF